MKLQETWRDLWTRTATEELSEKDRAPRHIWDLNKGLIGLSSILIAWLVLAVMTVTGLSHLSALFWT